MYCKLVLAGRLTKDWKVIHQKEGNTIAVTDIAYRHPQFKEKQVEYMEIKVWDKVAELCLKHTGKGSIVLVDGTPQKDSWEYEGKKYQKYYCNAHTVTFLDPLTDAKREGFKNKNEMAMIDAKLKGEEYIPEIDETTDLLDKPIYMADDDEFDF